MKRMTSFARPVVLAAVLAPACTSSEHRPPPSPPPSSPPVAAASAPKKDAAPADPTDDAVVALPIPPRHHAPEAPPEGWCGETAIQEALLYLGIWAPQELIHRSGRSVHPDLYSNEIPTALAALGVEQTVYAGGEPYGRFVRRALDEGAPVIAGVKILPTQHPEWGLDHFVLAVGYGDRGILVDTTWGYREWLDETVRKTRGLSLWNAFYAIRLGRRSPARLAVLEERAESVRLHVACVGHLERAAIGGDPGHETWASTDGVVDVVPSRKAWRYTCLPR